MLLKEYNVSEKRRIFGSVLMENGETLLKGQGFMGGAVMMNAIVVMSFIGVFVGKVYYYSKYSHKR